MKWRMIYLVTAWILWVGIWIISVLKKDIPSLLISLFAIKTFAYFIMKENDDN